MSRRHARWPAVLLVPLCAALFLPGLRALPAVDRDEARYVAATREMLVTGAPVLPRLQGRPRLAKPIGAYWLQAGALRLAAARDALAAQRLPSALGALLAVLGTWAIGRRWFAGPAAWLGAACLAASALVVIEAHLATTDAVLLAAVVAAQGCLAALYGAVRRGTRGRPALAAGFWLALAAGVLIKGPVAPLVSGLTVAALVVADRRLALLAALRPLWGLPLALAALAPWVAAVAAVVGWRALPAAMAADLLPKLLGGHESHGLPPGTYLLLAPATFWPGSLALVFAASAAWRRRRRRAERFLLAWLLPAWLCLELVPTKLPHYVLPLFPALALLVGRAAGDAARHLRPAPAHAAARALLVGWALLTAALGVTPLAAAWWLGRAPQLVAALLSALIAAAIAALAVRRAARGDLAAALRAALLGAVGFYAPLLACTLPGLDPLWPSRAAAAAIARRGGARPVAAVGYHEPSLLVAGGSHIAFLDADGGARFLAAHRDGLVLVATTQRADLVAAARRQGLALRTEWSAPGINYTKGERVDLHLFSAP